MVALRQGKAWNINDIIKFYYEEEKKKKKSVNEKIAHTPDTVI